MLNRPATYGTLEDVQNEQKVEHPENSVNSITVAEHKKDSLEKPVAATINDKVENKEDQKVAETEVVSYPVVTGLVHQPEPEPTPAPSLRHLTQLMLFQSLLVSSVKDVEKSMEQVGRLSNIDEQQVLTSKYDDDFNLVQRASVLGNLETLKILLKNSICVSQLHTSVPSPFWLAAKNGHLNIIKCLLPYKININNDDGLGTPLYIAAKHGHVKTVKALLLYLYLQEQNKIADIFNKEYVVSNEKLYQSILNQTLFQDKTLLQVARENKHSKLESVLSDLGAIDVAAAAVENKLTDNETPKEMPALVVKRKKQSEQKVKPTIGFNPDPNLIKVEQPHPIKPLNTSTLFVQTPANSIPLHKPNSRPKKPALEISQQEKDEHLFLGFTDALRNLLFDNVLKWQENTGINIKFFGPLHLGGTKIENPKKKGQTVRVPKGIATMIDLFVNGKAMTAEYLLRLCCKTALDRQNPAKADKVQQKLYKILTDLCETIDLDEKGKVRAFLLRKNLLNEGIRKLETFFGENPKHIYASMRN